MNLRFAVLIIISLFLFFNCEKEQITEPKDNVLNESEIDLTMVDWNHIEFQNKGIYKFVTKHFEANSNLRTSKSDKNFTIDENRIQIISRKNYSTYAFVAYKENSNSGELSNYVIKEHKNGKLKHYLLTYYYSFDENGNKIFDRNRLDVVKINDVPDSTTRTSGCYPELVKVGDELICNWTCSGSGNHTLGDSECSCETTSNCIKKSTMDCYTQAVYDWNDCTGGGGGGSGSGDTGGSDTGDGSGSNTGGGSAGDGTDNNSGSDNEEDTTSTIPLEGSLINSLNNCINGSPFLIQNRISSSSTTIPWNYIESLNLSYAQLKDLHKYLVVENGCSEEAQEIAILSLEMEDFFRNENSLILDYEQDYRAEMSIEEKIIFDNLSRPEQLDYLKSGYIALEYSKHLYGESIEIQYNGIGDAYRHCLWNAICATKLGLALTKELTDAHEENTSRYEFHYKERQMDLYNNSMGRDIGLLVTFMIPNKVKEALENGEVKYLSNTTPKATSSSRLIPTNQ